MAPVVRFDDLHSEGRTSYEFTEPGEVVTARRAVEVVPALTRVEELSRAGWWLAGFVSYDAAPGLDPGLVVPGTSATDGRPPLVWFAAFRNRHRVDALEPGDSTVPADVPDWQSSVTWDAYRAAVAEIKGHIARGDTYQVNHTFRLRSPLTTDPYEFYRNIAMAQGGAYCAYLDTGTHIIASASPESFFRLKGHSIRVKPMKGTARRGRWPAEDAAYARRLLASQKDRAENIMIVDLLRNDVGRIARFGSVVAENLLVAERYETVWQLTSEVSAELREGVGLVDIFAALFPSGSVTGAPKKRTMEIIRDLEASERGVYCGAIGYVAPETDLGRAAVFSVAIRTAVIDKQAGFVEYGVGGGITWDSTDEAEYAEAMLKADVLRSVARPPMLLETLRWGQDHGFWLLDRHLDRLAQSAAYFGFEFESKSVLASLTRAVAGVAGDRLVRLTVDRIGLSDVTVGEVLDPRGSVHNGGPPLRVAISEEPVASNNILLFHKTTLRELYDRRLRLRPELDDVFLVNERGEVTDTTRANIAVNIGGRWVTPPLDSGCLAGTYRAELINMRELVERVVTVADLVGARAIALINSVRGWRPAVLVE